jgi:hypothetical protein
MDARNPQHNIHGAIPVVFDILQANAAYHKSRVRRALDYAIQHAHERCRLYVDVRGAIPAPEDRKLPSDFYVVKERMAMNDDTMFETLETFFDDVKVGKQPPSRVFDWSVENRIFLPRSMLRPNEMPINMERLVALDDEFEGLPLELIRDGLALLGPECALFPLFVFTLYANARVTPRWFNSVQSAIPQIQPGDKIGPTKKVRLTNYHGAPPTHVLALYDPLASEKDPRYPTVVRSFILAPTHAAVIQSHCAMVSAMVYDYHDNLDEYGVLELPIFYLPVPYPRMWNCLHQYFYIKQPSILLKSLLPDHMVHIYTGLCEPCVNQEAVAARKDQLEQMVHDLSRQLAQAFTAYTLVTYVKDIIGMRLNAIVLGIHEEGFWFAIDLAYKIILRALAIGCSFRPIRAGVPSSPVAATAADNVVMIKSEPESPSLI